MKATRQINSRDLMWIMGISLVIVTTSCGAAVVDADLGEDADVDRTDGEVDADRTDGEVDADRTDGEVDADRTDGEVDADRTDGEVDADTADGGCSDTWWYPDRDGDGYGTAEDARCSATWPGAGYVEHNNDCCDTNLDVPTFDSTFEEPYQCGIIYSFDYDCDGIEERELTATDGGCTNAGTVCQVRSGWSGEDIPSCGESGTWVTGCLGLPPLCDPQTESRAQACR
jgi:hypothetical protein